MKTAGEIVSMVVSEQENVFMVSYNQAGYDTVTSIKDYGSWDIYAKESDR